VGGVVVQIWVTKVNAFRRSAESDEVPAIPQLGVDVIKLFVVNVAAKIS
jgi:hypothetical protein